MTSRSFVCTGHPPGFHHLGMDLGGLEESFHVSFKFEEAGAGAEHLVLCICAAPWDGNVREPPILRFGLPRSEWTGEGAAVGDQKTLMERVRARLAGTLESLQSGGQPPALTGVEAV